MAVSALEQAKVLTDRKIEDQAQLWYDDLRKLVLEINKAKEKAESCEARINKAEKDRMEKYYTQVAEVDFSVRELK